MRFMLTVRAVVLATLALSTGCFASFDRSKAIEVERHWYGMRFKQDGRPLGWGMMKALEAEESARPHVEQWRRSFYGGLGVTVVGATSIAYGIGAAGGTRNEFLNLGAFLAVMAPAEVMMYESMSAAAAAAAAHNAALEGAVPAASAPACEVRGPWIGAVPDGRGGGIRVAGVALAF